MTAAARRDLVLAHYDRDERDAAMAAARTWLADDPDEAEAAELLAGLQCDAGDHAAATALLETAIARHPAHAGLRLMLATAALGGGDVEAAIAALHTAIALDPGRFRGEGRFSLKLRDGGEPEPASPAPANTMMALTPLVGGDFDDVVDLVTNATRGIVGEVMKRNPKKERDLMALASGYVGSGNMTMAAEIYEILLKIDPENPMARHMLAAAQQEDTLPRAADDYVACLFNAYAEGFDDSLAELKYQAPLLVAALLTEPGAPEPRSLDVLDLGCGTGLCGPLVRPHARRLVGVDLSVGMLRKARDTGLYDKLIQAEITKFLEECKPQFDVIVSSDVLVYFGRLEAVFAGAARALRQGGRLIFTVEHLKDSDSKDGEGGALRLNPHGRYSHRESYVREALIGAGLTPVTIQHAMLRMEREAPVDGLAVLARKL
ncbi:MAG: methyltransferase domain-containing protein [Alphaproteobacteria bacterium]|nr:methyltransferase domain-containing protein [Alphaproteobacteria bacterium]